MPKAKKSRRGSKKSKKGTVKRGGGCKLEQKGGVVLPSEYFGNDSGRYSANPHSCPGQNAVSRGTVSADGKWAGPSLKPQHAGGKKKSKSKKMNKRKHTKKANKKKKTKKTKKTKKSKSRKH